MCIVPTFVGSAVFFFLKTLNDVQNSLSINYGSRLPPTSFFSSFFLSMKIKILAISLRYDLFNLF